jgi:hypothetical protein
MNGLINRMSGLNPTTNALRAPGTKKYGYARRTSDILLKCSRDPHSGRFVSWHWHWSVFWRKRDLFRRSARRLERKFRQGYAQIFQAPVRTIPVVKTIAALFVSAVILSASCTPRI